MPAKKTMKEVINVCNLVHVATLDKDGNPCVRPVDFVGGNEENIIYFITSKQTRKVEQIQKNPIVGIAIDKDVTSMEELAEGKFIKGTALAEIVEDQDEQKTASDLLFAKFPYLAKLPLDSNQFVFIRLSLKQVLVTDNSIQFGHTEEIAFS